MKKFILLILLCFNFVFLNGQSTLRGGFTKGYIITLADTIHCYVLNKNNFHKGKVIKYKFTKEDKVKKIEIDSVQEVYDNFFKFKKIVYNRRSFLVKLLIKASVSLYALDYHYEYTSGPTSNYNGHSWTSTPGFTYSGDNCDFFMEKSGNLIKINRETYKNDIKRVLKDNPEITKKIDDEIIKYKDVYAFIKALVNNYNTWLNTTSN